MLKTFFFSRPKFVAPQHSFIQHFLFLAHIHTNGFPYKATSNASANAIPSFYEMQFKLKQPNERRDQYNSHSFVCKN